MAPVVCHGPTADGPKAHRVLCYPSVCRTGYCSVPVCLDDRPTKNAEHRHRRSGGDTRGAYRPWRTTKLSPRRFRRLLASVNALRRGLRSKLRRSDRYCVLNFASGGLTPCGCRLSKLCLTFRLLLLSLPLPVEGLVLPEGRRPCPNQRWSVVGGAPQR